MAKGVQGVFGVGLAVANHRDAGRHLDRPEDPRQEIAMVLDVPGAVREHEIELAFRAGQPPGLQSVEQERAHRNGAGTGFRLRRPEFVEPIDAPADRDFAGFEIDVCPEQAAQLRRAQPGKQCRQDERTVPIRSRAQ